MNDIIKNIEAAQLKAEVADFNVGDTVKVSAKVKSSRRNAEVPVSVTILFLCPRDTMNPLPNWEMP